MKSWNRILMFLGVVLFSVALAAITAFATVILLGIHGNSSAYNIVNIIVPVILLLIPQTFPFILIGRKSKKLAALCYLAIFLFSTISLAIWSYSKERKLSEAEIIHHDYIVNIPDIKDDSEILLELINKQAEFLLSSKLLSAEVFGAIILFALLMAIYSSKRKLLTSCGIFVGITFLFLLGIYLPFPIEGRWGRIGGCMTSMYNNTSFSGGKLVHCNICGTVGYGAAIGNFGNYKKISFGTYEWTPDELGSGDEKYLLKSTPLLIRIKYDDGWQIAGYRDLDFFTYYRFHKYAEKIRTMVSKKSANTQTDSSQQ